MSAQRRPTAHVPAPPAPSPQTTDSLAALLAAANTAVLDLRARNRRLAARLARLRAGTHAELTDHVGHDEANSIFESLGERAPTRTFRCSALVPITIGVAGTDDAAALREARQRIADEFGALARIAVKGEPDCFGIDDPTTGPDGHTHRLVHTTLPVTVLVEVTDRDLAYAAANRRLPVHLRRLRTIQADTNRIECPPECP